MLSVYVYEALSLLPSGWKFIFDLVWNSQNMLWHISLFCKINVTAFTTGFEVTLENTSMCMKLYC